MAPLTRATTALLSAHGPDTLIKLIRANRTHRNVTYTALGRYDIGTEPFNTRECASGGLYGCRLRHLFNWVALYPDIDTVAIVRIPDDADSAWFDTKFKASALDVLAYVPLFDVLHWTNANLPPSTTDLQPDLPRRLRDILLNLSTHYLNNTGDDTDVFPVATVPPVLMWCHAALPRFAVSLGYREALEFTMCRDADVYSVRRFKVLLNLGVAATEQSPAHPHLFTRTDLAHLHGRLINVLSMLPSWNGYLQSGRLSRTLNA